MIELAGQSVWPMGPVLPIRQDAEEKINYRVYKKSVKSASNYFGERIDRFGVKNERNYDENLVKSVTKTAR